ncbi:MAG: hypothetical protein HQK96_01550 [Nitrospirae bacterium]|nr:hypothetical protein [Nitrospirota bacterium]
MGNSTVDFQAKFNRNQEAVASAFSKIGYKVMFASDGVPKINRDLKEIYIPIIKEKADNEVIHTIRGWVDHEMAHEICGSDHRLLEKAHLKGGSFETIFRLIEDGRVERIESQMLLGCKENLQFNETGILEKHKDSPALALFILAKYGHEKLAELSMADILKEISPETAKDITACLSCDEAYKVSERAYKDMKLAEKEKAMKELADKKRKDKAEKDKAEKDKGADDEGESSDADDEGESSDGEGESDGGEESTSSKKSKKSKSKKSEKTSKGDEVDEGDSGSDAADLDSLMKGEGESDSDSDSDSDSSSSVDGTPSGKTDKRDYEKADDCKLSKEEEEEIEAEAEALSKEKLDEKMDGEKDISDMVVEGMKSDLEDAGVDVGYIPYTKDDMIQDLTDRATAESLGILKFPDNISPDILRDVNVLSQKLRLELLASKPMKERYKDTGFLDNRRMHYLGMHTKQENVFMKRLKKEGMNTAVTLLVDSSGSMAGEKVVIAREIASLMVTTMETLSIPCEVLSFTQDSGSKFGRLSRSEYARFHPLCHYIHKPFDKRVKYCTRALNAVGGLEREQNADGESVLWAASRLSSRTEMRKLLFVLSDGVPCNCDSEQSALSKHLKDVVELVSKHGIECVGIGIKTDVKTYYKNYVRIDQLNDVVSRAYAKIAESIRGAKKSARK